MNVIDPPGAALARKRWGTQRIVRLDDLSDDERSAVLTLVRLFGAKKDATEISRPVASKTIEGTSDARPS